MDAMEQKLTNQVLLLALAYAKNGLQVYPTAKLFDLPPDDVEEGLKSIRARGNALCAGDIWRLAVPPAQLEEELRAGAANFVGLGAAHPAGETARGLSLFAKGNLLDGTQVLLEQVRRHSFGAATSAALCLDMILEAMERSALDGMSEESRRQYILTVIDIANVASCFVVKAQEACPLLDKAIHSAKRHGDRRSVAILHIIKAHMITFATFDLSPEADRLFQTGFEMGKSFGDEDMLEYVATFLGFRHFVQGHFPETVRYLGDACHGFTPPHAIYWWELFNAMSSSFVGLDRQAVGILESGWRTAELRSDRLSAAIMRLHLALLLLMAGKLKEALGHLDALSESIGNDSLPFLNMRLSWILVYYHFLSGNLPAARAMLERCAEVIEDRGMGHPTYHFPWMITVLHAFKMAGLPDVPTFGFESELEMALGAASLQLQASAWRVKGLLQLDRQELPDLSRAAFKRSLKLYLTVGNPVEAARVKLDLARASMLAGRRAAAERLRDGAFAVHQAYGQPEWPDDLPRPRSVRSSFSATRAPFGSREHGESDKSPIKNLTDVYQRLLTNLCRSLRVEQGALFSAVNGEITPLTSFNLSATQFESTIFSRYRSWLRKEGVSTQITRRSGPEGHAVCIPVNRGGDRFVLYFCNTYFTREIDAASNAALRAAAEAFCENLQLAERLNPKAENTLPNGGGDLVIMPQVDPGSLLTQNRTMMQLLQKLEQISTTDAPVLIFGETGVGKELLAQKLHKSSGRKGPFVCVHPASMTETLFESAFFGHEKGSFTGATSQKIGFFELANHGTLFIDEVGEMPLSMQIKFLRVLQERSFIRVGGLREIHSDFRLVTATNRDLDKEVTAGAFRQDLYYRLSVVPIHVPPLRMRGGDALHLAQHFLSAFVRKYQRRNVSFSKADLLKIASYPWPGNVRELENVIERAVILVGEGPLELSLNAPTTSELEARGLEEEAAPAMQLIADWPPIAELERRYIKLVLEQTGGRIYGENGAEAILGIGRSTLYAKIRQYGFKSRKHYD
ncbi:MAG: hypothetical protein AUJ49_10395 [Desulfovibrionaceae bacterium CG1_02_65_16]|nr:MAG: hypothetical protein AUJ49_10395 [Desulfovibrionaceae bacterium CG1_02_65_16]